MATIKNLTVNTDRSVTLTTDTGDILTMSSALAGILREQYAKHDVRDAIRYVCEDADGDTIALGSFDGTVDEFIDEVFSTFEDDIECGVYPSEEAIEDAVLDTANTYGICIDD
jgi:diacylglycerol kinase family enzyme